MFNQVKKALSMHNKVLTGRYNVATDTFTETTSDRKKFLNGTPSLMHKFADKILDLGEKTNVAI